MQNNKNTIGRIIEDEVRKQQIPITEFAKLICCQRSNVYDIFKRDKMDIIQLKRISKVLKRNFFKELAEDIELINEKDITNEEKARQKAVSQFFEVVPTVLHELKKPVTIIFCKLDEDKYADCPTPDFGLANYFITFTIGNTLKDRIGENKMLPIAVVHDSTYNCNVEVCTNIIYGSVCVNIKLDYKTPEEWRNVLQLAFETYERFGRKPESDSTETSNHNSIKIIRT